MPCSKKQAILLYGGLQGLKRWEALACNAVTCNYWCTACKDSSASEARLPLYKSMASSTWMLHRAQEAAP